MLPFIFILCFLKNIQALYENESDIQNIDALTIRKLIIQKEYLLINFFTEKCSNCEKLVPIFLLVAKLLKEVKPSLFVGALNCNENMQTVRELEVPGIPNVKMIVRRKRHDFYGEREVLPLFRWVMSFFGDSEVVIKKSSHLKEVITIDVFSIIGFFKNVSSPECKVFQDVANLFEYLSWAIATDEDIFQEFQVQRDSHIIMFRQFDDPRFDFTGNFTFEEVKLFLEKYSMPLLTEFYDKQSKLPETFIINTPNYLIGFIDSTHKRYTLHKMVFEKASKSFLGKVKFIYDNVDNHVSHYLLTICGIKKEEAPTYIFLKLFPDYRTVVYKPREKKMISKKVVDFVEGVLSGTQEPFFKTEKLHQRWDKYPVKVLVGSNYDDVTLDPTRAVFVQICSLKCVHCVKMKQMWHNLGAHFKDRDDLWIASLDYDLNDIKNMRVVSFPTFVYYPMEGQKRHIIYEGNRTLDEFMIFLDSGGTIHRKNNYTKVDPREVRHTPAYIKSEEFVEMMDPNHAKLLLEEL